MSQQQQQQQQQEKAISTSTLEFDSNGTIKLRLMCVGDSGVGKSSLLIRFGAGWNYHAPRPKYIHNFGVSILHKLKRPIESKKIPKLVNGDSVWCALSLWETGEEADYRSVREFWYSQTDVFLICMSIQQSSSTYERYWNGWYPEIKRQCPNTPIILVGTKSDLRSSPVVTDAARLVPYAEMREFARRIGANAYIECSSFYGRNVVEVFTLAISVVVDPFFKPKEGTIMKMLRAKFQPIFSTNSLERRLKPTSELVAEYGRHKPPLWVLPREQSLIVLGFLSPMELARFGRVCRFTHELAEDDILWIPLYKQKDPTFKYIPPANNRSRTFISPKKYLEGHVYLAANPSTVWINPFDTPPDPLSNSCIIP